LHPVGEKAPNPWGLHDMAGLVWKWCWDRYAPYAESGAAPLEDPAGAEAGVSRVVRGGSFVFPPVILRSADRFAFRPDDRLGNLGLRCVRARVRPP